MQTAKSNKIEQKKNKSHLLNKTKREKEKNGKINQPFIMLLSKIDFFECFSKFINNRLAIDKCYRNLKHQHSHHYSYHHHLHRISSKRKSSRNRHCDTMTETTIYDDNGGGGTSNGDGSDNNIRPSSCNKSSRCKGSTMSMTSMPLHSSSFIVAIVIFIVTIHGTTVNGASTRDSYSNSVYNNNTSINNVITANVTSFGDVESPRSFILADNLDSETVNVPNDINATSNDNNDQYEYKHVYNSRSRLRKTPIYQNEFAVYIPNGIDVADSIAAKHSFTNMGQVSTFYDIFLE